MIDLNQVYGGYKQKTIINDLTLKINEGEFFALIGPNGSGKTTLIKLMTGILALQSGTIKIKNQLLYTYSNIERAKLMAVLSQQAHIEFDFLVEEIVMLGRYPHQSGLLKHISQKDRQVVEEVMRLTDVFHFRKVAFKRLSGGEKQRVLLAKALAQEPSILFLDEPTNHLDIKHTVTLLQYLKQYQKSHNLTICAILHDLNTAALFADKVGLMRGGRLVRSGDISLLQDEKLLKDIYEVPVRVQFHPLVAKPQLTAIPDYTEVASCLKHTFTITNDYLLLEFKRPLRSLSSAVLGEGFQWSRNFCNFHVSMNYDCSDPLSDMLIRIRAVNISQYETVGMMTAVQMEDLSVVQEEMKGISFIAVVTAGYSNAIDITKSSAYESGVGTVNIMVFIDANLTDGAFVNAVQSVTEAKTKAFSDLCIIDSSTGSIATGTSTDSIVIASTQNGKPTPYAGSGTVIGKGIGKVVYKAVVKAAENYRNRLKNNL